MRRAEFIKRLLKAGKKHFAYRYIDDALFLNKSNISESLNFIYPCELEFNDMIESGTSASCFDC